jgi:Protein of unknown function (DUF1631)
MKKHTTSQYQQLMQQCEKDLVDRFAALLDNMLAKLDDDILEKSEKALNNEMRHRYQETLFELQRHKKEMGEVFCRTLRTGFRNFSSKRKETDTTLPPSATKKARLSLVDTEQYEKSHWDRR